MKPDTPLTEVAAHLPREAAGHLSNYNPNVQTAVLTQVRALVVFWEARGYAFDPIAYEGLLNGVVPTLAPIFAEVVRLRAENASLSVRLATADILVRSMGDTIAQMLETEPEPSEPQHNHDARGVYGNCPACDTVVPTEDDGAGEGGT